MSGQYIGVEYNTDQTCRHTTITRLRTAAAARAWVDKPKTFAFPTLADRTRPARDQNWHHRVRYVYLLPAGFRLSSSEVDEEVERWQGSKYRKSYDDARADVYARYAHGDMIPTPESMRAELGVPS